MMLVAFFGTVFKSTLPALAILASPAELLSTTYGRLIFAILLIIGVYGLLRNSLSHAKGTHSDDK
jgi:hypothetical protein